MKKRLLVMFADVKVPDGVMSATAESGDTNVTCAPVTSGIVAVLITAMLAGVRAINTDGIINTPKNAVEIIIITIGNKSAILNPYGQLLNHFIVTNFSIRRFRIIF
jgi:hypothetical protein